GAMCDGEARAIASAALSSGLSGADLEEVVQSTRRPLDLCDVPLGAVPHEERLLLLSMAIWIALVDSRETENEAALLKDLADALCLATADRTAALAAAGAVAALPPTSRPRRYDYRGIARSLAVAARFQA